MGGRTGSEGLVATHSMELVTCASYGCPGCDYRHFHRTSDDSLVTEVPGIGTFTADTLREIGVVAVRTGAVSLDESSASEDG